MARITVEDCLEKLDDRFKLVMLASRRARDIAVRGKEPSVPWEDDKATVVALREIAAGNVTWDYLQNRKLVVDAEQEQDQEQSDAD